MPIRSLLVLLILLLNACAEVEVRPLEANERLGGADYYKTKGVRFFRPWPYLWITVNKDKGICEMSINYLPQMEQEYIIIPHPRMGSVTMAPTLTNGWSLTTLSIAADSKASEMVTAIGNLTGNAAKAAAGGKGILAGREFGPGLYRIIFDQAGYVSDLESIFLQQGTNNQPARCNDLRPPPPNQGGNSQSSPSSGG